MAIISIILSLFVSINVVLAHPKCGHDNFNHIIHRNIRTSLPKQTQQQQQQQHALLKNHNKRNLQTAENYNQPKDSEEWDNMRIAWNADGLLEGWKDTKFKKWFAEDVIPAAIAYLEKVIQVRPIDGNLTLERKCNHWWDEDANKCKHISSSYMSCGGYHDIEEKYFDEIYECKESKDDCVHIKNGGGSAHDIVLYFVGKSSSYGCNGVYGFSSYCHSNLYDRPIAGFVNLCEETLLKEGDYFTWEKAVTLVVHEVYHVLGFSSTGFAYFRRNDAERSARSPRRGGNDGKGNMNNANFGDPEWSKSGRGQYEYGEDTIKYEYIEKREKTAAFIVLPTVLKVIRDFYNCSTMVGLELEDFGGVDTASSHWEQRILSMEFMIGYISSAAPVSIFSFAVFEDSGWYKMNWDYATLPPYGKGFGCNWYEEKCVIEDDDDEDKAVEALDEDLFCTKDVKYGCAPDYVGKSNCELKEYKVNELPSMFQYFGAANEDNVGGVLGYADFCPMFYHYSNGDCRIIESSHKYESFGADICPQCKCNELWSSDKSKNYAICYKTECAQNYLYADMDKNRNKKDENEYFDIDDFSDYTAIRIKVSNEEYDKFEYITCWSFESNMFKKVSFYSYSIKCPQFEDICYAKNPWICNGHGMINPQSTSIYDQCICNHGYIGCDCTIRDTQQNRANSALIAASCTEKGDDIYVNDYNFNDGKANGQMPVDEEEIEWNSLGLLNVTMQIDDAFAFENVLRTLRLWIAINVKIGEENVWIQSYEALESQSTKSIFYRSASLNEKDDDGVKNVNYSISIAYYDDDNQYKISPDSLITEFHYLFNSKVAKKQIEANENEFILYDIYNIKQPNSNGNRLYLPLFSLFILLWFFGVC